MNIANQGFPATRADLNNALQALASNNSGTSAPSTTFANQWWYDTTNNKLYIRNEANNAWIQVAVLDQTNNEWQITTGVIQAKDGDGLALKTDDGTTRLFIKDSDGAIGIGTSNPDRPLHIAANPAMIVLEDTGGSTDDKRAALFTDSGLFEIASKNDDDSTRLNDVFVADLGTGDIRMGDTGGTSTTRQKSFRISHQTGSDSEYGGVEFFRAHQNSEKIGASIIHERPGSSLDDSDLVFKTSSTNVNATEKMRIDHNGAVYQQLSGAGGGFQTGEISIGHLGFDPSGTGDIKFFINFTNTSGSYDTFIIMLYLAHAGNASPIETAVYRIQGFQRSSTISNMATSLVDGSSRPLTLTNSGLNMTITVGAEGSSTATQGGLCRVVAGRYGISSLSAGTT